MNPELPSRYLVQFDHSNTTSRSADCGECSSNFFLYFLRSSLGSECQLPVNANERIELAKKVNSVLLRILAFFMTFTLWLPLTLVGLFICRCSGSHKLAYSLARNAITAPTSPRATRPRSASEPHVMPIPPNTPPLRPTSQTPNPAKPSANKQQTPPPPAFKKVLSASTPNKLTPAQDAAQKMEDSALGSELAKFDRGSHTEEQKRAYILEGLRRIQKQPAESANRLIFESLDKIFAILPDAELAYYLPSTVQAADSKEKFYDHHQRDKWLPNHRLYRVAEALFRMNPLPCKQAHVLTTMGYIWDRWLNYVEKMTLQEQAKKLVKTAVDLVAKDPEHLHALYMSAPKTSLKFTLGYMLEAMNTETIARLASIKKGDFHYDLAYRLIGHKPVDQTVEEMIARVAAVPIALRQDPLKWIETRLAPAPMKDTTPRETLMPLIYLVLYQIHVALKRDIKGSDEAKDRAARVEKISAALSTWYKATFLALWKNQLDGAPALAKTLFELSSAQQPNQMALIVDGFTHAYLELRRKDKTEAENLHTVLRDYVIMIVQKNDVEKAKAVFDGFLLAIKECYKHRGDQKPYECLKEVLKIIPSRAIYESLLNAALNVEVELVNGRNPMIDLMLTGDDDCSVQIPSFQWDQYPHSLDLLRKAKEQPVVDALTSAHFPPELVNLVLGYANIVPLPMREGEKIYS